MSVVSSHTKFPVSTPFSDGMACFAVRAAHDPGVLPRLLEPFAKRGLVPHAVKMRQWGDESGLLIEIQVGNLTQDAIASIAQRLREQIAVDRVLVTALVGGMAVQS